MGDRGGLGLTHRAATVVGTLQALEARGVVFTLLPTGLRYRAPAGVVGPAERAWLRRHCRVLKQYLEDPSRFIANRLERCLRLALRAGGDRRARLVAAAAECWQVLTRRSAPPRGVVARWVWIVGAAVCDPEGARTALLTWAETRGWPRMIGPFAIEGDESVWRDAVALADGVALGLAWAALEAWESAERSHGREETMSVLKWTEPKIVPPGIYPAQVAEVREVEGEFGTQVRIRFVILTPDGQRTEDMVDGYCKAVWGPRSKLFEWATEILRGKVQPGEDFDTDRLLGKRCDIRVDRKETKSGFRSVVTKVYPYRTASVDDTGSGDEGN